MAISRNMNTDAAYNCLIAAGATVYGACGAMGNIFAESGFNPRNLEDLCEERLGHKYTDDTYTEAETAASMATACASGQALAEKPDCMIWQKRKGSRLEILQCRLST